MPTPITETEPRHATLEAALAAFQAELPKLRKDETAKVRGEGKDGQPVNYQYGYADLAQVVEAVMPVLGRHGLSFSATPTMSGGQFVLEYGLMHESGHRMTGLWPLPDPTRTKPQALGSAITYARRYALMAMTGTFPDKEDDDGQKAADVPADYSLRQESRQERPDRQQGQRPRGRQQPVQPADEAPAQRRDWTDPEIVEMLDKINDRLVYDEAVQLYDWMVGKELHDRRVKHPDIEGELITARDFMANRISTEACKPDNTRDRMKRLRGHAEARDLLRVEVSESETLDEALASILAVVNAAALDTDHARELRDAAAASFQEPAAP